MGKEVEFRIIITADAVNTFITVKDEDVVLRSEIVKAVEVILKKHGCKLLDVVIDT